MRVAWTPLVESDQHFVNGLVGKTRYWVVLKHDDGRVEVDFECTDKWGDFLTNDEHEENPEGQPWKVVAFAPFEFPEPPNAEETAAL